MKEPHTDLGLGAITNRRVETPTIDSAHLQSPRRSSSRDNEAREVQRLPTQTEPRSSYPWKTACPEENAQPNLRETIQDKGLAIPLPSGEVASGSTSSNAFEKQGKAPSIELLRGHWSSSASEDCITHLQDLERTKASSTSSEAWVKALQYQD
jgi:hypothetical protein